MSRRSVALVIVAVGAVIWSLTIGRRLSVADDGKSRGDTVFDRANAMNNPSKHAWSLFLLVNHPAQDPAVKRGMADSSKPFGEPGTTAVWETWRLAETEVFLERGVEPPDWDDNTLPGGPTRGRVPERPKAMILVDACRPSLDYGGMKSVVGPLFDPTEGIFQGQGGFGESRMNRATYDFIRGKGLYSLERLQEYATNYLAGKAPPLAFPVDSMEVKASWIAFSQSDIEQGKPNRYYLAEWQDRKFGLSSLHIITKDIPNWFWCTFRHEDLPNTGAETEDTYGKPAEVMGTVWENYRLGGTQTDFVTAIGEPTLLSDPYIELGFERSSCISCHARATAAPPGGQPLGSAAVIGIPNSADFIRDGRPVVMQTDFLFSLALRVKSEKE